MRPRPAPTLIAVSLALVHGAAEADGRISLEQALRASRAASPEILVAEAQSHVARTTLEVPGALSNPTLSVATSSRLARLSTVVSVPLLVLGQSGAVADAARADDAVASWGALAAWVDVRRSTERAFVALWLVQGIASVRRACATADAALEDALLEHLGAGPSAEVEWLCAHAERLRADVEANVAEARIEPAAVVLGRWMGIGEGAALRAASESPAPETLPPLEVLRARIESGVVARQGQAALRAAAAHVAAERIAVRPTLGLELGADIDDPLLGNETNYRARLWADVPLFDQHSRRAEREAARGDVARASLAQARAQAHTELSAAYRTYEAETTRLRALRDRVVPAATKAAAAVTVAFRFGRASLEAALDAERVLTDAEVALLESDAARADAYADVVHALAAP